MGKFSSAKMNGAQDVKFKNVYNSLIDLLETGYVVESMIGGHRIRVTIDTENGFLITKDGVKIFGLDVTSGNITLTGTASEEEVENLDNLISALDDAAVKLGVTYAGAAMSALSGFTSTALLGGKEVVINMSAAGGGLTISVDGVQTGGICLVGGVPALIAGVLSNSSNPNVWAEIGTKTIDGNDLKGLLMYRLDSLGAKYAASGWTLDADDGFALGDSTRERFFAHSDSTGMSHANGQAIIKTVGNLTYICNPDGTPWTPGATPPVLYGALLHFDADPFVDAAGHLVTAVGSPTLNTTTKKFGVGAINISTGNYLHLAANNADLQPGTGAFTIDCWFNLPDSGWRMCFGMGGSNYGFIVANSPYGFTLYSGGFQITTTTPALNTWHHVAVVGNGTSIKMYLNGSLLGTYIWTYNLLGTIYIGANEADGSAFPLLLDEFRFVKGEQLWTADFVPPTSPA